MPTREHGGDGEDLIRAVQLGRRDEHLGQLRIERKLGHQRAELRQLALVVDRREIVEQLERTHQRLRRRRIHEVKVHQIFDT